MASPTEQSEILEVEENYTIVKCKVYVVKVLIHCQGCSKTIKKDLKKIDGVYKIEVDSENHKVTVFADVEPEKLIKRLRRNTNRLVELCTGDNNQKVTVTNTQQSHQAERKKKQKVNKKEKEAETPKVTNQEVKRANENEKEPGETVKVANQGSGGGGGEVTGAKEKGKAHAVEVVEQRVKHFEVGSCSNTKNVEVEECHVAKPNADYAGQSKKMKTGRSGGVAAVEVRNGAPAGSGYGGEKKNGKGQNINVNTFQSEVMSGALPPILESTPVHFRPQQPQPPPQQQPILFSANFNTVMHYHAFPKLGHGDLRHVPRPVYTSPIYSHWGLGPELGGTRVDEPSSYYLQYLPPQLSPPPPEQDPQRPYFASPFHADSFSFFSDENINACSIM